MLNCHSKEFCFNMTVTKCEIIFDMMGIIYVSELFLRPEKDDIMITLNDMEIKTRNIKLK